MSAAESQTAPSNVARFGTFELDLRTSELHKSGARVRLQPQPCRILTLFVENPGVIISREELREKLWPADTYVEFDRSLNRAIVKLRVVLGDTAESPRFIETVPKRGYRFIAPVSRSPVAAPDVLPATPDKSSASSAQTNRRAMTWRLAVIGLVLLAAFVVAFAVRRQLRNTRPPAIRSIVVLPLENLSDEAGQEYLADGITDELITDLAKIRSLRVVSRTTAMHYKRSRESLAEIARALGIDAAVEGTVSRSANKIRIRAQLVRSATDEHVWANTYERDVTDALALQAEVARDIADEIEIELTPREKQALGTPHRVEAKAYEAYLKARYLFNKRTVADDRESIELYRKSIAVDPGFAAAYAGLADALALRSYMADASPTDVMPEAHVAVQKALELNSDLVDAHVSSGWIKLGYDWDWDGAEREIKRALELNPHSSAAHHLYGQYQLAMGRVDEAIVEHETALELDPLSPFINRDLGRALYYARRYDEALKQLQHTLELEPKFAGVVQPWVSWCYEKKNMQREAVEAFLNVRRTEGLDDVTARAQEQWYLHGGWSEFWHKQLKSKPELPLGSTDYLSVLAYARVGDRENALRMLRREVELHTIWVTWINIDPELDNLRSDPQFRQLLRLTGR